MSKIIKNCRREKGRGEKKDNFRHKLWFKLHDITITKRKISNNKNIEISLVEEIIFGLFC